MLTNIQILKTKDGSFTLLHPQLDETYHSIHGAIQESVHIYINAGLKYHLDTSLSREIPNILEIGFGTGLNILLTIQYLRMKEQGFFIHSIEKFPVHDDVCKQLNYGKLLNENTLFETLHNVKWNENIALSDDETFLKEKSDLLKFQCKHQYDVVYFDAFSPEKQAKLWTIEVFRKLYECMRSGAVLTTYSAKGKVRRNMQLAGFSVERIPGPPGKREMLRAVKY
jgi:tRNA U34 5-methylaminomethyl-2-thiouridine-forming methyltransferase MnmC